MDLFTYLMAKNNHNTSVHGDLFSYLLAKNGGTVKTITGTVINITDAKNRIINRLEMSKLSSQDGEPSPENPVEIKTVKGYRNELNNTNGSITNNGITFTKNNDGTITANGTSTGVAYYNISKPTLSAGIHRLSGCPAGGSHSSSYKMIMEYSGTSSADIGNGATLNLNTETTATNFYIEVRSGVTLNNVVFKPMIIEGTEDVPYVPYGSNYVYTKIVGKNLFDKNSATIGYYLTPSGNQTADSSRIISDYIYVHNKQVVTNFMGNWGGICTCYYDKNKAFISSETGATIVANNNRFTIPANAYYMRTSNSLTRLDTLQIESGTVSTETYEEYQENIITISLNGNEIAGTDSAHKDILLVDSNGHCYLQKNTRGLELAIADMNNGEDYPGWTNIPEIKKDYNQKNGYFNQWAKYLCNIHPFSNGISINTVGNGTFFLAKAIFKLTQSQWKEQYPDLVFKILYALQTPEIIDLNYDVDIRLFKGVNNISNSDDMDMILKYY